MKNIMFMWIAGRQRPDFRTINQFRSERMKTVLETVFTAVLLFLTEENYVQLEHYFVDGTKIEANANRYTFVWGKAAVKQKAKHQEKVQTLFAAIEEAEKQEERTHGGRDLLELGESSSITSEKLEHAVKQHLQEKPKQAVKEGGAHTPQGLASSPPEVRDSRSLLKKAAVDAKNQGAKREQAA